MLSGVVRNWGSFQGFIEPSPACWLFFCGFLVNVFIAEARVFRTESKQKEREGVAQLLSPATWQEATALPAPQNCCQGDASREAEPTYPDTRTKPGFCEQKEGQCRFLMVFKSEKFHAICLTQQMSTTNELNFPLLLERNSSDKLHFPQ